jgi:hypothetical protein
MDLHGAYVLGNAARLRARRGEEEVPRWVDHLDPLETLFLGAGWPQQDDDAYRFANACATWLRVLCGTAYWAGIELFVREALIVAAEFGLPDNSGELYIPLRQRFETDGRDLRKLPPDLLPARLLDGARCFDGPAASLRLPDPAANADELITQFWAAHGTSDFYGDGYSFFVSSGGTPYGGLLDGLRALRAAGRNGEGPAGLLKGLYAGLVLRDERRLPRDLINRAIAWALGLPAESPLVPVVDVLLVSVKRGLATEQVLGRLFGVRAFGRPVSEADRQWRSSPGTALRRVAREMFS